MNHPQGLCGMNCNSSFTMWMTKAYVYHSVLNFLYSSCGASVAILGTGDKQKGPSPSYGSQFPSKVFSVKGMPSRVPTTDLGW